MKKPIPIHFGVDKVDIKYIDVMDGAKSTKLGGYKCGKNTNPKYICDNCDRIVC